MLCGRPGAVKSRSDEEVKLSVDDCLNWDPLNLLDGTFCEDKYAWEDEPRFRISVV